MNQRFLLALFLLVFTPTSSLFAQVGDHRNNFSIGVNGGYTMTRIGFTPKVEQQMLSTPSFGMSFRYVCEKYFSTICSVYGEMNYVSLGWQQDIKDVRDMPVINVATGFAEEYKRTMNYIQVPIFAHLGWGRESKGMQFFFQAGPQFGFFLNEKTTTNYDAASRNMTDRASAVVEQESLTVDNKFDYGIAVGAGLEYSIPRLGHFLLEGRYYYGLGNTFGNSKRDYFGRSNHNTISVKLSYLFDITLTKNN